MLTFVDNKNPKKPKSFYCEKCNFKCSNKKDFNRHIMTAKHFRLTIFDGKSPKNPNMYICDCGKLYKSRQGLHQHVKKCILLQNATDATDATDVNVSDVNGDDVDTLISSFKTDNCKNGLLMKDDKEVTMDSITKSFPSLKFLGETCNPCEDDCKFEIVSSSERLTAEENVTPVDSTTIPVDREALTKKQDE